MEKIGGSSKMGKSGPKPVDISGQRFGRLTAIKRIIDNNGKPKWECLCDCGNTTYVPIDRLRRGNTKSCGCIVEKHGGCHGGRKSRLYTIWTSMKARCNRPSTINYKYYGGKGVRVCREWETDYPAFEKWALEHGYSDGLTIDRIDDAEGYTPQNCQWITRAENTRKADMKRWAREKGQP